MSGASEKAIENSDINIAKYGQKFYFLNFGEPTM